MALPSYAEVSRRASALLLQRGEWCGFPMPIPGLTLDVEPKNPWREAVADLEKTQAKERDTDDAGDDTSEWRLVNRWYSRSQRCWVDVVEHEGRYRAARHGFDGSWKTDTIIRNMQAASAWTLDTELKAIDTLATLLKPHLFEAYVMTGAFLETSARSRVTYVFRRCRPTLALIPTAADCMKLLCALCLHPIGYYRDSHAGSMTPTDDVMAHLLLMRADEPMFWRRANQHPWWSPNAGL